MTATSPISLNKQSRKSPTRHKDELSKQLPFFPSTPLHETYSEPAAITPRSGSYNLLLLYRNLLDSVSQAEKSNVMASNLLKAIHVCLEPSMGTNEILDAFRSLLSALLYFKDAPEQHIVTGAELDRQAQFLVQYF